MSMLGIVLTGSQERAVRRLISYLDEAAACYQFSGGFAGNLPGPAGRFMTLTWMSRSRICRGSRSSCNHTYIAPSVRTRMMSFSYNSCERSSRAWKLT